MAAKPFTIGRLARATGINLETVRYYERQALLPTPPRSSSGYRLYSLEAARRLQFIKHAQELGFSLKEIRELLALRISPGTSSAEVRNRAKAKIRDIEAKIRILKSMRKSLYNLTVACSGCGPISECPILASFDAEDA